MVKDVGEYVAGEYLKYIKGCDVIDYNVRTRGGGSEGQNEFDVVGFDFASKTAYLCEVATHLSGGLNYGGTSVEHTIEKVLAKHKFQKLYAEKYLSNFPDRRYMLWSPIVPVGKITEALKVQAPDLDLIINKRYSEAIGEIRALARQIKSYSSDPFFRLLQILEALK